MSWFIVFCSLRLDKVWQSEFSNKTLHVRHWMASMASVPSHLSNISGLVHWVPTKCLAQTHPETQMLVDIPWYPQWIPSISHKRLWISHEILFFKGNRHCCWLNPFKSQLLLVKVQFFVASPFLLIKSPCVLIFFPCVHLFPFCGDQWRQCRATQQSWKRKLRRRKLRQFWPQCCHLGSGLKLGRGLGRCWETWDNPTGFGDFLMGLFFDIVSPSVSWGFEHGIVF